MRNQARGDGVLDAGAEAAEDEGYRQHHEGSARASNQVCDPCDHRAYGEERSPAEAFCEDCRWDLESGHRTDIEGAKDADLGIAKSEFRLPKGQQHVLQIRIAVVKSMRPTG